MGKITIVCMLMRKSQWRVSTGDVEERKEPEQCP